MLINVEVFTRDRNLLKPAFQNSDEPYKTWHSRGMNLTKLNIQNAGAGFLKARNAN